MKVKFFINLLLPFLVNSYTVRNSIKATHGGIELGIATFSTGILMDNTIAKKSLTKLKKNSNELYNNGMKEVVKNLIVLGPLYHYGLEKTIIFDYTSSINLLETFEIVFIHSIGYYSAHKLMHKSDLFREYHKFHHKFNETLIPSIGNAVSSSEFTFAYITPFLIGALVINPNINSLNLGVFIISLMNLVIHTQELSNVEYKKIFVSPKIHHNHHQGKNKKNIYSAPTFNLEFIYSDLKKKLIKIYLNIFNNSL